MPTADDAALIEAVGPRLRALRHARAWTLDQVAAVSGISVSTLSRLETGKRSPSLDLLLPLARTFRVPLDDLVGAPATGDPRVHLRPFRHRAGSVLVPLTGYPGRLHVFKQVLHPRPVRLTTHDGRAWFCVLTGTVRLVVEAEESLLRPGDVAAFEATQPHWFGPADDEPVELLHLFGPHGDRPRLPGVDRG